MIDFIEATKCLCKDSPFLGHCNPFPCKLNQYGWETYTLQGCKELEVHWHPEGRLLRLKGSIPYWWQGHNFIFTNKDFVDAVEVLQNLLQVGLWDAEVSAFEFGCIFQVEGKPTDYIRNHNALPKAHLFSNERGRDRGHFRWWEDAQESLKMYDAKRNILMKQGLREREVIEQCGYNPEKDYLKFEVHFKKAHLLNGGKGVNLEALQNPVFINHLRKILVEQYHLLKPMRTMIQPTTKKALSALDCSLQVYVEEMMNQGIPVEDAKKRIYNFINQQEVLSKADKDSRKATIRRAFSKMQEAEGSQWDLTHQIEEALVVEV